MINLFAISAIATLTSNNDHVFPNFIARVGHETLVVSKLSCNHSLAFFKSAMALLWFVVFTFSPHTPCANAANVCSCTLADVAIAFVLSVFVCNVSLTFCDLV